MHKRMRSRARCFAGSAGAALLALAAAAGAAETNATTIKSERLSFDYKRSVAQFEGNVRVEDARMRLQSDKLTVMLDTAGQIKSATAVGAVRIWQADRQATCDQAVYLAGTGEVILSGHAHLERGTDAVDGKVITFYLNDERMTVEPGLLLITPGKGGLEGLGKPDKAGGGTGKASPR